MEHIMSDIRARSILDRLVDATNGHDLEGIVACFAATYRNETPAHPARNFTGREQVRRNWQQILAFVPDIQTAVVRVAVQDATVWSEWEHRGTRRDGSAHLMRGVIIFGVEDDAIAWARFYLEPVEAGGVNVGEAVRAQVDRPAATGGAPGHEA
jgi:hypothetical protein